MIVIKNTGDMMYSKNNLIVELFYYSGDYEFTNLNFIVTINDEKRIDRVSYQEDHLLHNYIFSNDLEKVMIEKNYYDIIL